MVNTLVLEKFQKKYKRAKKALDTGQHSNESATKELIPYPTGKTHGRGEYNLADDLLYYSEVSKEDYNTFIVRRSTLFETIHSFTSLPS
jgi:hypothetical protein